MTAKKAPAPANRAPTSKAPARSAKRPSTALATRRPTYDGMIEEVQETAVPRANLSVYSDAPQFDNADLFIPKLRLAQGLTAEVQSGDAKPGQWLVLGAAPAESVTIVPMGMTKRREYRDSETRMVLCRSGDAVTGVGKPGGPCVDCPLGHWTANTKKGATNNLAPGCTFIYSYMVYVVESRKMAILELAKTGELAARMLNTMLVQGGFGTFGVRLTSTPKQGPRGTYYAPSVTGATVKADELKRASTKAGSTK